jgi:hypothetical protein
MGGERFDIGVTADEMVLLREIVPAAVPQIIGLACRENLKRSHM